MRSISSPPFNGPVIDHIDDHEQLLTLTLSTVPVSNSAVSPLQDLINSPLIPSELQTTSSPSKFPMPPVALQPSYVPTPISQQADGTASGSSSSISRPPTRRRKSPPQTLKSGKSQTVPAPYPWATTKRATVHSLKYLLSNGIGTISGEVQCRRCDRKYKIEYNLQEKFSKIATFISENKNGMHDRAPPVWMNPILPSCQFCEQSNCVKPIITKKRTINWLFLLLGEMLGCCKLAELKYFCKHTRNHRTGAKDRVLYLTYLGLCKQLDP